ncbi:tetratricopeptide repeat protein [candidate division KSB1 bacterium]|nr:tetratricopeptide repeat protein [candidate division KSB1 bacterium]
MKNVIVFVLLCGFFAFHGASAQSEKQSNLGIGVNLGLQKLFADKCGYVLKDVHHTAFTPAGEFFIKFLVSERINLAFALGYSVLGDGFFDKSSYETYLFNTDIKAHINLRKFSKVNPYLTLGIGALNYKYTPTQWYSKKYAATNLSDAVDQRFTDAAFILGGGMEVMTSEQFALNMLLEYRLTTSDNFDGGSYHGKSNDGYYNGRVGFVYYLGKRPYKTEPTEDELMALQRVELGEVDEATLSETDNNLAMFEAKLDELNASEADVSMEQYIRLKSRVDELNQLIDEKEREIGTLRSDLGSKNQRIFDLQNSLSTGGSDEFSIAYEKALGNFYSRNYSQAISDLQSLKERFPYHKLVSNCQYWIGECYFGMGNYQKALESFRDVFNYGFSYKKDDATLMLGRCYYKMNDRENAKNYFQELLDSYPDSEYIDKARQWLARV